MLQSACGLRFAVEPLQQRWVIGHARSDGLQGNQAVDDRIARPIHNAHRAVTQFAQKFVFAQLFQFTPVTLAIDEGLLIVSGPNRLGRTSYSFSNAITRIRRLPIYGPAPIGTTTNHSI